MEDKTSSVKIRWIESKVGMGDHLHEIQVVVLIHFLLNVHIKILPKIHKIDGRKGL